MSSYSLYAAIFLSFLLSERVNYWNLGISINKDSQVIVQKSVNLNNIKIEVDDLPVLKGAPSHNTVFTLKTNTFIQPKSISINNDIDNYGEADNIKALILNEEYFDAAKQVISLDNASILEQFSNLDEFYYWSSFIFYHLGNYFEAKNNIMLISNRTENPEMLFLEALILQASGESSLAASLFHQVITEFPHNDYADYAKNILLEQ